MERIRRIKRIISILRWNDNGEFLNAPGDLSDLIRKVHVDMNNESPKHWNKILFNLNSEGKFNLEFKWDQDKQDQFEEDSRI